MFGGDVGATNLNKFARLYILGVSASPSPTEIPKKLHSLFIWDL